MRGKNQKPGMAVLENPDAGFRLPGQMPIQRIVRQYRREQKAAGLRGQELRQAVRGKRQEVREEERQRMIEHLPEDIRPFVHNPRKFFKGGRRAFLRNLTALAAARQLGPDQYGEEQRRRLAEHLQTQLPTEPGQMPPIDYRRETAPTAGGLSSYIASRFERPGDYTSDLQGLSPQEEAMYRQRLRAPVEQAYQDAVAAESQRLAAAGLGSSGIAADTASQLRQERLRGLTGAEGKIIEENLARKRDYERLMTGAADLEERGRQFDVGQGLERLGDIERGMRDLWLGGEGGRQFDYSLTQGRLEAERARRDRERALRMARPGFLEKFGAAVGGVASGFGG